MALKMAVKRRRRKIGNIFRTRNRFHNSYILGKDKFERAHDLAKRAASRHTLCSQNY